ncbi:MAG: serine hydrolase [Clostridia bacterium]|nr:serine hydrolase [Clostridia bacterium]
MFEKITPEQAGISSFHLVEFFRSLARSGLAMHSVLMMKGEQLLAEYYWAPFHRDFCHRMYSQTKSYVSIAIGLLEEDGKLSLDDPIVSYFPDKIDKDLPPQLMRQTIREMLMMETCHISPPWFTAGDPDRTHLYLNNSNALRPSRTIWQYDSAGSQVLSALVERLSGMSLFDFLSERIFRHLGTFKTATMLKTPNGDTWGDSALVCTTRDMMSFGRFVMNGGIWQGKRLMNAAYLKQATSALVDNDEDGWLAVLTHGYGYQIWHCENDGFAFVGMGGQLTLCFPALDFIFCCTADLQGNPKGYDAILRPLLDLVVYRMKETPLPRDAAAEEALAAQTSDLKLLTATGKAYVPFADKLNGKTYLCATNRTGITEFTFTFEGDGGVLRYVNAQGEKELPFGLCRNEFCKFPQFGYSNDTGGVRTTDGFLYDAAVSAAWREEQKLALRVQIIDRYFGNLRAIFAFRDDEAVVTMFKCAEDFLGEYEGTFNAKQKRE